MSVFTASKSVLMIAYHFPPSNSVGMQRTVRFVRHLSTFDWQPVLLTAREQDFVDTPVDGGWAQHLPASLSVYRTAVWRPLKTAVAIRDWLRQRCGVKRVPHASEDETPGPDSSGPTQPTWVQKWVDPWLMTPDGDVGWVPGAVWKGLSIIRRHNIEVVYTSGPPHSSHLIGAMLKCLTGRRWVADFRDPWTRRPWLQEEDRQGVRYRLLVWLEASLVSYADQVVLNTVPMAEEFRQFYPLEPSDKFSAILNGYDPDTFPVNPKREGAINTDVFTVTHAGSLYRRRDPRPLLDAVAQLRDQQILEPGTFQLNLVGSLDPQFQVPERLRTLNLESWVALIPPVPYLESLDYLSQAHLLLLIQPDTHLQVPGKLFEYLYLGKPILALTGAGATAELIHKHQLGTVVEPSQRNAMATSLGQYYQLFRAGEWRSTHCQAALARFHARELTQQLATLFDVRY